MYSGVWDCRYAGLTLRYGESWDAAPAPPCKPRREPAVGGGEGPLSIMSTQPSGSGLVKSGKRSSVERRGGEIRKENRNMELAAA